MYVEFKPGQKFADKNGEQSDNIATFRDAGYILNDDDLIVDIDVLTHDQIKKLIEWFGIKTETVWTDRGVHFYFHKPQGFRGAKSNTPIGVPVEYKHTKNTFAITVKRNGIARTVENHGTRMELPNIFEPSRKADNMVGLSEGDGRNDKLFAHRSRVSKYENWHSIMDFINQVVFAEPLPESEMEALTRNMKVAAVKDGENLIAGVVAKDLKVVKYGGQLWYKPDVDTWYKNDLNELKRIIYTYAPDQKTRYIEEIYNQLSLRTKPIDPNQVFDIRLNNGVLRRGKFIDIPSDDFTPYAINLDYDPNTKPVQIVDDYLDNLSDHDKVYRQMIEEILGYCLFTDREAIRIIAKFFFFVGSGGNGKGTLLEIIRKILGDENASSVSIDEMTDERYFNNLVGKLANLGDDVEDKPIDEKKMKILKNISTADTISFRKLYEDAFTGSLAATLIFTTNHILKSFEKGESYKRRVVWCPMYYKPKTKSPTFISDITNDDALNYWIKLIVEGYERLYKRMHFVISDKVQAFNDEYHEENNSVIEYLNFTTPAEIVGKTSPEAYDEYEAWAEENDYNTQSKRLFKETLKAELGIKLEVKKINGKSKRVFLTDETTQNQEKVTKIL